MYCKGLRDLLSNGNGSYCQRKRAHTTYQNKWGLLIIMGKRAHNSYKEKLGLLIVKGKGHTLRIKINGAYWLSGEKGSQFISREIGLIDCQGKRTHTTYQETWGLLIVRGKQMLALRKKGLSGCHGKRLISCQGKEIYYIEKENRHISCQDKRDIVSDKGKETN